MAFLDLFSETVATYAESLVATGTWYHVMSFSITQCHERRVPKLPQSIG
jgi:hypothetical protein